MAPLYAGVLGLLAFVSCLTRGLLNGSDAQTILLAGCLHLGAFAAIGAVLGYMAGQTIEESVRKRVADEVAAEEERERLAETGVNKPVAA